MRMALFHLTVRTLSRGGKSGVFGRFSYIVREGRYRRGNDEVAYRENGNMPSWGADASGAYWSAADAHERANARLCKTIEFSLPVELTPEQRKELAVVFCRELVKTKDGPLPYSFAVHDKGDGNPHCHLIISERVNDGHARSPETWFRRAMKDPIRGGARKTEKLKPRSWLADCREQWASRANAALACAGHDARMDHRSLVKQGIDRMPTAHLGPAAAAMERKGRPTERGEEYRERLEAVANIRNLGHEIAAAQIELARIEKAEAAAREAERKRAERKAEDDRKVEETLERTQRTAEASHEAEAEPIPNERASAEEAGIIAEAMREARELAATVMRRDKKRGLER
jgi:hypothetical protein